MEMVELWFDGEVTEIVRCGCKGGNELIDLCYFLLVLFLFQEEGVLFEKEEVDIVEAFEVVVWGVDVLVVLVLHLEGWYVMLWYLSDVMWYYVMLCDI